MAIAWSQIAVTVKVAETVPAATRLSPTVFDSATRTVIVMPAPVPGMIASDAATRRPRHGCPRIRSGGPWSLPGYFRDAICGIAQENPWRVEVFDGYRQRDVQELDRAGSAVAGIA
jgi:hypothetical protein